MNHSMYSADGRTHLKIVVIGLLCATLVAADQAKMPIEPYRGIQRWRTELASLPGWTKAAALMRPPG